MEPAIHRLVRADIGGDHQWVDGKRTRYTAVAFKHVLLPVWVAAYRYRDRPYQVVVNGRTGRVTGHRPWSVAKVAAVGAAVLVVVLFAVLLAVRVGR